jgi:hypothetical protein
MDTLLLYAGENIKFLKHRLIIVSQILGYPKFFSENIKK